MTGPLAGIRVIEMVGLGPCPFAAMMLSDMGAEVIRIDKKRLSSGDNSYPALGTKFDVLARGRRSLALDLKQAEAVEVLLQLIAQADVVLEGYRPGVMERLGLAPDVCMQRNARLVYGRVTGWGQTGPLAQAAGHDINYLALSGMLHAMGRADTPPAPPLNLVADFGGGAMMLAFGTLCALLEAKNSGKGQVVDAAMVEGSALLGAMIYGFKAFGSWSNKREENLLDGGAHFYDTYLCADGKFISIGAIEPPFYALLLRLCKINDVEFNDQMDVNKWPALSTKLANIFKSKSQQDWCTLLEGSDACFAPVLDMTEAAHHPHNQARGTFIEMAGVIQPAPAPRFSRSITEVICAPATPGEHSEAILKDWGIAETLIATLLEKQII